MDYGIGKPDKPLGANQTSCPQISQVMSLPLLPKNCVALVGNTTVVLGQQVVIMDSNSNKSTGEVAATVQSDAARFHNREANAQSITGITPALHTGTSVISNVTPQDHTGLSPMASPFGNIQMVKASTSNTLTRTINVGPVCVKPSGTDIKLSNQTIPHTQFRDPGYLSVRHMLSKHSQLNQSEIKVVKPKPQFAVQYSSLYPGRICKTQGIQEMSSVKSAHKPKPLLIEETSEIPKEVPSGSITVNLNGQAVKIVGLPAKYSQTKTSLTQKKVKEIPQENPKTTQLESLYDKKMNTLKLTNNVFQKSSVSAPNRSQMSHNPSSSLSQILPASSRQSQKFMIGNVASLSPHSQSQVLNNAQHSRTTTCIIPNRGLVKVPGTYHPPESTIIDLSTYKPTPAPLVIKPTTQPYPTLQTILKTSVVPKTFNSSSHIYSHPQISVNSAPAHQYYPQGAIKIGPKSSRKEDNSSSNTGYYTLVKTFNEGHPVMVVRPVLDSNSNNDMPLMPEYQDRAMEDSRVNSSFDSTSVDHQAHQSSNTELQGTSKSDIDNEKFNSPSDLKIQSVFSLANISSTFPDLRKTEDVTNNAETELDYVSDIIDVDDEEETTFNINDPVCKKVCPPSYVVLERLCPQDIEDKKMGRTKITVQCSHHCRVRTLSYLCNLNLMDCENQPKHRGDSPVSKELEPLPYTTIDVEDYDENDLPISADRTQKENSTLFSSIKEVDSGTEESRKKAEVQVQSSTKDVQNDFSISTLSEQKEKFPLFSSIKEVDGGTEESRKKAEGQAQSSTNDEQNDFSISTDKKQKEKFPLFSSIKEVDGVTETSNEKADGQAQSSTNDEQNDFSISTDKKQKEKFPLFSSIKEVDGGTEMSSKKAEGQAQSSTIDEQNEGSQLNKKPQINKREKRNTRPPNKFSPESQKNESLVQENGEPNTGTLTLTEISSNFNEKEELISLKRQVDMKRLEMKKQKKRQKCSLKSEVIKRKKKNNTTSAGLKTSSKQSSKLPVILGSRLKPGIAVTNQSDTTAIKNTPPLPVSQASSCQKPSLIRPTYIMNCPASSLFGSSNNKGSLQSTSRSPITTIPLLPKNSTTLTQPKVTVPLTKVYATLKSLATQLEITGQKPIGTQFVMFKAINGSVLLKIEPEALLPGNLEALHKAAYSSALSKQTTPTTSHQNISKPSEPMGFTSITTTTTTTTTTSATNSFQNLKNHSPTPLTENPLAEAVSSAGVYNQNITTINMPQKRQYNQISTVPSSVCVTDSVQNAQNIQDSSSVFSSSTISGKHISLLASSHSGNSPLSSQNLRSLLQTTSTSNTYNDANSILTRVPPNSSLLPERQKKRPSNSLSEEEKIAKRRKFEAKYPLPPGIIIKSEPDTSEYDIDNNWSVTTEIDTGFINPSEVVDNMTATEAASERVISASSTRTKQTTIYTYGKSQHSDDFEIHDPDSTDTAEEDDEISDLPPILDELICVDKDSESSQDENKDDTPPVLQPMPTLGSSSFLEENVDSGHESASIEKNQGKSSLLSQEPSTKVSDSGYDSVSTSSSVESLVPGQTHDKPPVHTAKSKIQQLKELLRQKELQVENMRKKRSEMPEVDLNAL